MSVHHTPPRQSALRLALRTMEVIEGPASRYADDAAQLLLGVQVRAQCACAWYDWQLLQLPRLCALCAATPTP